MKRKTNGTRKIQVLVMLTAEEMKWLDKKVDKTNNQFKSRSALIRYLIRQGMGKGVV